MKKSLLIALLLTTVTVSAQTEEKKTKEIRKEVRVENENGVKTVEILTVENGMETKEVYTGSEADQKLAELESQMVVEESSVRKEVKVEEIDGTKKLTVRTESNGKVEEEVYVGPDVDKKLKELEAEGTAPKEMEVKKVERIRRTEHQKAKE